MTAARDPEPLATLRATAASGWLVGGAVRDRLLGRETTDWDVATDRDPSPLAQSLAHELRAHPFKLSEGFGGWRVVAHDHSWQVDILPLLGETVEQDLRARDLTVNAIAEPLAGGELIDPTGGRDDIRKRLLRMVSPAVFAADPLRTLRIARLACDLDFSVEPDTAAAARTRAPAIAGVAPERIFAELKRIVVNDRAVDGLRLMDGLGVTEAVLPELTRLRGVEQSVYHHLDVHEHTRAVLAETIALEQEPERWLGPHAAAVRELLDEPLANELTRGEALRFGALFHDVAKPQTRSVTDEGRVTFIGHDAAGAEVARTVLERLRASDRLCEYVAALTRNHLRLGFLVREMPLSRRAIYRYLSVCEPVAVDVTLLSIADRLATRGRGAEQAIERHLELARQLLGEALRWRADRPRPPLRGDELAREVGLAPGPELGRVLRELEAAAFAGEISTRADALTRARELLGDSGGGSVSQLDDR